MAERLPLEFRGRVVGEMQINEDGTIDGDVDMSLLDELQKMDLTWDGWSTHFTLNAQRRKE
jgi:hypothetical protein